MKHLSTSYSIIFSCKWERQARFLRRNRWEANRVFLLHPRKTILLNYTIIPASVFLLPEEQHRNARANQVMRWMVHLLRILLYWNGQPLAFRAEAQNTLQRTGVGQFFPLERFPPLPHPRCALQNCHFKQLLALCLELGAIHHFKKPAQHTWAIWTISTGPHCIWKCNWGGREDFNSHCCYCCSRREAKSISNSILFYSIPFHPDFIPILFHSHSIPIVSFSSILFYPLFIFTPFNINPDTCPNSGMFKSKRTWRKTVLTM